jgi:hypothetical protein
MGSDLPGITGTSPDIEAIMLPSSMPYTSNAFHFVGRLQDLASFQVDYEAYCSGIADSLFFYFGATGPPRAESDYDFHSFTVANNIYLGRTYPTDNNKEKLVSYQPDMNIWDYTPFTSAISAWIPMRITYTRTGSSIQVAVMAYGNLMLTTVVNDASTWLNSQSGGYWGMAGRAGMSSGRFSFRRLAVQASDCTYLGLPCLPGSSACSLNSCGPGTYSTSPGMRAR